MHRIAVNLVFEDELSQAVMETLLKIRSRDFEVGTVYSCHGFGQIKKRISGFNAGAAYGNPFFVLTDLDQNICPLKLIESWLYVPVNPRLLFRVAVHEIESWILADSANLVNYLEVDENVIPAFPDSLPDPKQQLLNIVKKSKRRNIKEGILPSNETAVIGPCYNLLLCGFVRKIWNWENAQDRPRA